MKGTVMIVEDQPNFRKGLRMYIENHSPGWTVIGEAANGQEALERMADNPPDLVLTDIRMPVMDGLQLAERISRNKWDVSVVIITGYKDFEYAQAAIQYGVLDFLIKPCTDSDISGVLVKAYEKLRDDRLRREKQLAAERANEEHLLRSLFLRLPYDPQQAKRAESMLLQKSIWLIQVEQYVPPGKEYRQSDIPLLQYAIANVAGEIVSAAFHEHRLLSVQQNCFALFLPRGGAAEAAESWVRQLQEASRSFLGIALDIRPLGEAERACELADRYEQCLQRFGERRAVPPFRDSPEAGLVREGLIKELETKIMAAILLGQLEQLNAFFASFLLSVGSKPLHEAKSEALSLSVALYDIARKQFAAENATFAESKRMDGLFQCDSAEQVAGWTAGQIQSFTQHYHDWQASKNENIIEKTIRFIEDHYMDHCSLSSAAAHVHLNAGYLSALFKKTTGESYTGYVTKIRMEKAKLLLMNTSMKITEVARAVGYDEPNYFANVFRHVCRCSPTEFRKNNRSLHSHR
jgi:two-component system response regulator YesN